MHEIILPPHAASLSQSLRDLGYSLETAIADLIDNSITAEADNIRIFLDIAASSDSSLSIIDNGYGMTEPELLEAMRPGSRNPRDKRSANDLGRFGLGLKTASFSQCKSLTVVSRKHGSLFAAQWDLDLISERDEWVAKILSVEEIRNLPFIGELGNSGTYVLWQKLDRLLEHDTHELNTATAHDKLDAVEKHLSLVFHRYIAGDYKKRKLVIQINGHPITAFDPFCTSNKATQLLPEEIVRIKGHEVRIQPYILPHHSKLSRKDYDFYRSRSDFVSNQGAYIYRNGRLMAWGDWFKLIPKSEATKLARVRIDFPNALDELWTIDIKKSRARAPLQVREQLKQIIIRITDQSKRVHTGRGNRLFEEQHDPLWVRYSDRDGIRYNINRDHPLIASLETRLNTEDKVVFEDILSIVERGIPVEAIYADYSTSPQSFENEPEISYDDLKERVLNLYQLISSSDPMDKERFTGMICALKPFSTSKDLVQKIVEELSNG